MREAVAGPSLLPDQRAINVDIVRTLRKLIDELSPQRGTLIRSLFSDTHHAYANLAHIVEIPLGGIGPTRARVLRQLRHKLDEHDVGPDAWQ